MNTRKFLLLLLSSVLLVNFSFSQNISVNPSTGAGNIVIPVYTINAAHVSLPISLNYYASGVKANDVEGTGGVGWQLNAGGAITRELRGLPDDNKQDLTGASRLGWLYNTNGANINAFSIGNDNNPSTCNDETTDINYINSKFTGFSDTEPDIFDVDVPGLSCKFIFDNNNNIRTIPYLDVKINYTTNSSGNITSFSITNDQGITYLFANPEVSYQKATLPNSNGINYFTNGYNQYKGGITYYSAWDLTSIKDNYNNAITITYNGPQSTGQKKGFTSPVQVLPAGGTTATGLYTLTGNTTPNLVNTISYSDAHSVIDSTISFTYQYNPTTQKSFVTTIDAFGRNIILSYSNITTGSNLFNRYFLNRIADIDCASPVNYTFSYNNPSTLPDSTSNAIDYWGYYNGASNTSLLPPVDINPGTAGYERYRDPQSQASPSNIYLYSLTGSNRMATSSSSTGSLTQVTNANGGYTTLSYEPNDYYDNTAAAVIQGGGIRVKQLLTSDGINTSNNMIKTYTYVDPSTAKSSGKPISLPVFAFTTPYTGGSSAAANWTASTVRSYSDLSSEDHTIVYSAVTEAQSGAGSTLYQFMIPATNWDTNITSPLPWSPTITDVGRLSTGSGCPATGFLVNDKNTYPFPPNLNYDFERGLVSKITNYNNSGNEVNESDYTYQTPETPVVVTGFKFDSNTLNATNYAKYTVYTSAGPLTAQVINKIFDLNSTTAFQQTTTNYTYAGALHKKLTQQSVINSDGSVSTSNIKYAKDYTISTAGDSYTGAIQTLQSNNNNAPIETYYQVTPAGSSQPQVIGGALVKYGIVTPLSSGSLILPVQSLKFRAANGLSSFQPSSISGTGTFTNDPNYIVSEDDLGYDYTGAVLTKDDGFKKLSTVVYDHNTYQPVAIVSNARFDEIALSDFDSNITGFNFTSPSALVNATPGRSGKYALTFNTGITLSKTVNKNTLAQNYIFSMWINSTVTGQVNVSVTGGNTTNTVAIPFSSTAVPNTTTGWKYYEVKLPLTGITSSTITISASSTQNISADDILSYPDVAEMTTYTYDPQTHLKTSQTNTNGVATYFDIDEYGRERHIYDQDKNMIIHKQYVATTDVQSYHNLAIIGPASLYTNISGTYAANISPCYQAGLTYSWTFSDNPNTTTTNSVHTFTAPGTYTINLTVSSPVYGTKTASYTVTVTTPAPVNITYTNSTSKPNPGTTGSSITQINFQSPSISYTFTTAQLSAGNCNIYPGTYNITISATGPSYNVNNGGPGYTSINVTGNQNNTITTFQNKNTSATAVAETYNFSTNMSNAGSSATYNFAILN